MLSSSITSITVLLIIDFVFREGFGLFSKSPVEHGTVLAVNANNPVKKLSAMQVKKIFDQEITNWKQVGGKNDSIILFHQYHFHSLTKALASACIYLIKINSA